MSLIYSMFLCLFPLEKEKNLKQFRIDNTFFNIKIYGVNLKTFLLDYIGKSEFEKVVANYETKRIFLAA